MKSSEQRGREFLDYCALHNERLRYNLKKNITLDPEIFDDVFSETVLRVYERIVSQDLVIEDYEKYFFQSSRFNYINAFNKRQSEKEQTISLDTYLRKDDISEEQDSSPRLTVDQIREEIAGKFGEAEASLFMDYFGCRIRGRCSYVGYAKEEGLTIKKVSSTVRNLKKYLRARYGLDKKAQKK